MQDEEKEERQNFVQRRVDDADTPGGLLVYLDQSFKTLRLSSLADPSFCLGTMVSAPGRGWDHATT